MPLEVEVKFLLSDPEACRRRIADLGARSSGRRFESNLRFDDKHRTLLAERALLRLRADRRFLLTFKAPSAEGGVDFKVHRELEVEVSDFNRTAEILQALGYRPVQRYEKWRETYHLGGTDFCLDTLPFGEFLEIEGEKEAIRRDAERIGLNWGSRILDNYLHIFELIKHRERLPFTDVTFENFEKVRIDPEALRTLLKKGLG
jgi:adenylate cyclase class 2